MAFIDQGEFEAMKTLSLCRAPRCDEDRFRYRTLLRLAVFRVAFGHLYEPC